MEVARLRDAVTPHVHKGGGQTTVFSLSLPNKEDGTDSRDVKNVFLQISDGWSGTLVSWSDKADVHVYIYDLCFAIRDNELMMFHCSHLLSGLIVTALKKDY